MPVDVASEVLFTSMAADWTPSWLELGTVEVLTTVVSSSHSSLEAVEAAGSSFWQE